MDLRQKVPFFMNYTSSYLDTVTGNGSVALPKAKANGLKSVKLFGGTEQSNLQAGFTQLEYIESTGTQYIDTGLKLNQNNIVEVEYCYHTTSSIITSGRIFGARYTSSPRRSFSVGTNSGYASSATQVFSQLSETSIIGLNNIVIGQWNSYKISADGFYINGVKQGEFAAVSTFETPFTVKLFAFEQASSSSGTPSVGCGVGRCRRFKVWNGDTLVMDLIPAKNISNEAGMYDIVSGKFFANRGTGTFAAGQAVVPTPDAPIDIISNNGVLKVRHQSGLPLGYQMVEWLKPAGPIVITGFKTKSTQEIETVFYRERSGASYLYSSDTATSGTTNTTAYLTSGAGNWRWDGKSYSIAVSVGVKFTSIQNNEGVWLNGTKYGTYTDVQDFVSTNDLRLSSGENTTVRIYSQTIREGDTVTLDLVPVQRLSDSLYGFYDKVGGGFYTNTEAAFVAGDVIDDPIEIYTDGTVETVEVAKNYFTREGETTGQIIGADGTVTNNANYCISAIVTLPAGNYTCSWSQGESTSRPFSVYKCDSNGNVIATKNGGQLLYSVIGIGSGSFSIDTDTLVRISYRTNITENSYVMLSLGTATAEMLLGVGDYKDEQSVINGHIVRNIGIKVLDGTEDGWSKANNSFSNSQICPDKIAAKIPMLCTHFVYNTGTTTTITDLKFGCSLNGTNVFFRYDTISTVEDWQTWLANQYANGTPVIVVYPLETATTETVTSQTLQVQAGTNVLQITQASIDNLPLEATYKRGK